MSHLPRRSHSTAPIVLTRADGRSSQTGDRPVPAPRTPAGGWSIGTVLTWVVLSLLIVGLWVLLLAGDSLSVSG